MSETEAPPRLVILVLADLTQDRQREPMRDDPVHDVTGRSLEHLMAELKPRLQIEVEDIRNPGGPKLRFEFAPRALSDFDSVSIQRQVTHLRLWSRLHERLERLPLHDSTYSLPVDCLLSPEFASCLGELRSAEEQAKVATAVARLVDIVDPSRTAFVPSDLETRDALLGSLSESLAAQTRLVRESAGFRRLHAAWLGLNHLADAAARADDVRLLVLDVSKRQLLRDLEDVEYDLSCLFRQVYEERLGTLGVPPVSLIVCDFEFTRHPDDIELLRGLSHVAGASLAPVIASAGPEMFGMSSHSELHELEGLARLFDPTNPNSARWISLRESEDASLLHLCLPRVLVRGSSDPAGDLPRSMPDSELLWANPSWFVAAWLIDSGAAKVPARVEDSPESRRIRGLAAKPFRGPDGDARFMGPTEGVIDKTPALEEVFDHVQARELAAFGFVPLCRTRTPGEISVPFLDSVHHARVPDDRDATARRTLLGLLDYSLPFHRFVQTVAIAVRDGAWYDEATLRECVENSLHVWRPRESGSPSASEQDRMFEDVRAEIGAGLYEGTLKVTLEVRLGSATVDPGQVLTGTIYARPTT